MEAREFYGWRQRVGLTQEQVAGKLGVTRTTIQNWESGATGIPIAVDSACEIWGHRLKQESPTTGPVTLIYSDAPMFITPGSPRRQAMLQQESFLYNAAALGRVLQLWGRDDFQNPFIVEQPGIAKSGRPLWNAVELARVVSGDDQGAPTPANWQRSSIKAAADYVMAHSDIWVRKGPRVATLAEAKEQKRRIEAVSKKLEKLADVVPQGTVTYQQFEELLSQLHQLGTYPPNAMVSSIAHAFAVA